jgi:hypothetical protein
MNKKAIAFLSILFLFISLPVIPVNAAAKAGGVCTEVGVKSVASGKTFTCIKTGKKLVWSKGISVKPTPTASNTSYIESAMCFDKQKSAILQILTGGTWKNLKTFDGWADCKFPGPNGMKLYAPYINVSIDVGTSYRWILTRFDNVKTPTEPEVFKRATYKQKVGTGLCDLGDARTISGIGKSSYIPPSKSFTTLWDKYKFTKPTSTESFKGMIESSFKEYISVSKTPPATALFYIQPGLLALEEIETFEKQFKMYVNLLTATMPRKPFAKPISMVAFTDPAWAVSLLESQKCSSESIDMLLTMAKNAYGWAVTEQSTFYLKMDFIAENGKVKPGNENALTNMPAIPHEIYHLVQFRDIHQLQLKTFDIRNDLAIPTWFTEGSADLLSRLVIAYKYPNAPFWGEYVLSFNSTKVSDDLENIKDFNANYSLGRSACEFLTYLVGFEKVDAIWIEMGKNKNFSIAFQDSTGIELVDFYNMFAEIRPVLGIPKT